MTQPYRETLSLVGRVADGVHGPRFRFEFHLGRSRRAGALACSSSQDQVETARQALRISKWALGIAIVSAFVAVAGLVGK